MRGLAIAALFAARKRAQRERRRGRTERYLGLTILSGLALAVAMVVALSVALVMVRAGLWWMGLAWLGFVGYLYLPAAVARAIAVPLGWPRVAYHTCADRPQRLLLAAWALGRARTTERAGWIEAKRDAGGRLGDTAIVTTALIAAARGDRDGARTLLESLALMPEITPIARELAAEWLAVDDAERGQWRRLLERAPRMTHAQLEIDGEALGLPPHVAAVKRGTVRFESVWPATPLTFLLEGVAARLLGSPDAPGDLSLFARWLEAPRRRHTWALVKRATAAPREVAPTPAPEATPAPAGDPLAAAVGAHSAALACACPAHVSAAAAAWDAALASSEIRTEVLARAIDVGAPADAGHRVLDDLARTAADELATLILAASLPVAGLTGSPTLERAVQRARHRLLGDLELATSRTAQRVRDRRALPAIDEWRELCALAQAHRRAVRIGGDELRRLAFPHLHAELTSWLVWLWNDRGEHALSDALTCWLLAEALAAGDAQAIETHARNASMRMPARPA